MDNIDKVAIAIVAFLLAAITGMICYEVASRNMKEQAVLKGYGEWKSNPDGTHNTFHWK
jgi:hypothetical protein